MSMSPQQIQQAPARQRRIGHGLLRSTWVTAAWNWFLMLAGKAAEPVLTISVIYSCARLLPAVHMPLALDNAVFVAQMVALDIGGLGLRKLANQARRDGNEDGATLAGRVSTALIVIMVINVALSVLESIAPLDPNIVKGIEGVLLIARAVMAVLYAFVIHSLHADPGETMAQPQNAPHPQLVDFQEIIDRALDVLTVQMTQRFAGITAEQQRMMARMSEIQATPEPPPAVDLDAIALALTPAIRATNEEAQSHLLSEVRAMLEEVKIHQTKPAPRPAPEPGARNAGTTGKGHRGKPNLKVVGGTKSGAKTDPEPPEARTNGSPEERLQAAYEELSGPGIRVSGRALARKAHVNRGTTNEWLSRVQGPSSEPDDEDGSDDDEAIAQGQ